MMEGPEQRPRDTDRVRSRREFSLHPLSALDGVMIVVLAGGETVDFYFGATELAAASAVAVDISAAPAGDDGRATS